MYKVLIAFFTCLALGSCCKNEVRPVDDINDFTGCSGYINGHYWDSHASIHYETEDAGRRLSLADELWFANTLWVPKWQVLLAHIDDFNDTLWIKRKSSSDRRDSDPYGILYTFQDDGDVVSGCYEVLDEYSHTNYLIVDDFDHEFNIISGRFNCWFLQGERCPKESVVSSTDTIHISNCSFRARFVE